MWVSLLSLLLHNISTLLSQKLNFSLQYQYNIKQAGDENNEKY